MDDKKLKGQAISLALVALVTGVLVGVLGSSVYNMSERKDTEVVRPGGVTEAGASFGVELNSLLVEHAHLSATLWRSEYDSRADVGAIFSALEQNSQDITARLSSHYPETAVTEYEGHWDEYIATVRQFVVAARDGDTDDLAEAEDNLNQSLNDLGEWLAERTETEAEVWTEQLEAYSANSLQSITSYVAGNYDEAYAAQRLSIGAISELSDMIAEETILRYPDSF